MLFLGLEESFYFEVKDEEVGFIVVDINKCDIVGEIDGIIFFWVFEFFLKIYSEDFYDILIYFFNSEGDKGKVDVFGVLF